MKVDVIIYIIIFFTISGCDKDDDFDDPGSLPEKTFEEADIDSVKFSKLSEKIKKGDYGDIHSLLLIRNGSLIFEEYYNNASSSKPHDLQSAAKSIASVLTGIAIDKGYFNESDSITDLLSASYNNDGDPKRNSIKVQDVLTMKHGIQWKEWGYSSGEQDNVIMANSDDWIQYVLDRPMKTDPGTEFNYSTGASVLLSGIIHNQTGQSTEKFAETYLFSPVGIKSQDWWIKDINGIEHTGGGLKMTSRDLACFGLLILNDGMWKGKQIISEEFLASSFKIAVTNALTLTLNSETQHLHYGYHWWIIPVEYNNKNIDVYTAMGTGGQFVFIIKEFDLVVVSTAWNVTDPEQTQPIGWLKEYIFPALK